MSLKKKALGGILWTFSEQVGVQLISFFIQYYIARQLMPSAYGLIAMLTVFVAVSQSLMQGGMTSSLIRTANPTQEDYSTVFFFNVGFSVVLYLILFFSAPFISGFYDQQMLTPVLRVYAVTIVIQAFVAVQTTILTKKMDFKKQLFMRLPSQIIGGIVGIVMAFKGLGVWALVWMNLINTIVWTAQHWFFTEWRPAFIFSKEKFREHFGYGYKLTLSGVLNTVFDNIYNIIIGKFFSAQELGFYNRAYSTRQLPLGNIATAINKVTFPLFAEINDDNVQLKSVYKRLMVTVLYVVVGILLLLSLTAFPFFRLTLTSKWLPAAPYFQLLCMAGIFYPLHVYNLNILQVKGRSDLFLMLEVIKKAMTIIGIIAALPFGIYGLLYFQIIMTVLSFCINTIFSGRMINYPLLEQLRDISPVLLIGAISYISVFFAREYFISRFGWGDWVDMLFTAGIFGVVYIVLSFVFRLSVISEIKKLIIKKK